VQVPELGEVDATNLVPLVLNEAYLRFPDVDHRRNVLSDVTHAVFDRLASGRYTSLRPLAEALARAAEGRHLLMSSSSDSAQTAVRGFDADGSLPDPTAGDSMQLTVQNLSGNKLDYYVDTALSLGGERKAGAYGDLAAEVVVTNTAPVGATGPRYLFGPYNADQTVGVYRGLVSLYLPAGTSLVATSGDRTRTTPAIVTEGGRPVASWVVDVPPGERRRLVLRLKLAPRPPGPYSLSLVLSARVRPTTVTVAIRTGPGEAKASTALDRPVVVRDAEIG
jgi:hypothetical protein